MSAFMQAGLVVACVYFAVLAAFFRKEAKVLKEVCEVKERQRKFLLDTAAKWKTEAMLLTSDDGYRGLHGTVVLIEDRLGLDPSDRHTVKERWQKIAGRIDPFLLKIMLNREPKTVTPARERAAKRMLALQRHLLSDTLSDNERRATQNQTRPDHVRRPLPLLSKVSSDSTSSSPTRSAVRATCSGASPTAPCSPPRHAWPGRNVTVSLPVPTPTKTCAATSGAAPPSRRASTKGSRANGTCSWPRARGARSARASREGWGW